MVRISVLSVLLLTLCEAASAAALDGGAPAGKISYNRQIRPLLSDNCFLCHGPDKGTRKADLRLDVREVALEKKAFVPGDADESELVKRIFSSVPEKRMPPPESHKELSAPEKELLKTWIAQGAEYQPHWAYLPPERFQVPAGTNAVDFLVRRRLASLGLAASPRADARTLARRLHFDLVGLPATPEQIAELERAPSPAAYSNLVEKLMASPQYGERMAIDWLDVARFADTIGYHSDNPRNIWPYRDYVIRAFNRNKPFDQFTLEQLAGDLLPDSGVEQKVGSAFNRLLLTTEEGGAQPKDYEYRMLTDRVRAVGTIWLGQTLGCATCHDHKFDPTTMRDFYSMGAFFADIQEPIIGKREEGMLVPTTAQQEQLAKLGAEESALEAEYESDDPAFAAALAGWEQQQRKALEQNAKWQLLRPRKATSAQGAKLAVQIDGAVLVSGKKPDQDTYTVVLTNVPTPLAGLRLEAIPHESLPQNGPGRSGNGNFVVTEVVARVKKGKEERAVKFASARASYEQTFAGEGNPYKAWVAAATIDQDAHGSSFGWAVLPETGKPQHLLLGMGDPVDVPSGATLILEIEQKHGQGAHTLGHFRLRAASDAELVNDAPFPPPPEIAGIIAVRPEQRSEKQRAELAREWKSTSPQWAGLREKLAAVRKGRADLESAIPRCLVSVSSEQRRTVHILPRGNFLAEQQGEIVQPALPSYLPGARTSTPDTPLTRLDLAQWLVSRENPLTARVTVNRLWKHFFGAGLSRVLDDLGAQGEPPPNPELLDWLACEFMDSGWNVKHMVRLMVNTEVYQQVSTQTPELRLRDPYNRETACQSRWRLDAEMVRDNALFFAGLLDLRIGGPSARPYQPEGYWENLNFPPRTYEASGATDQYRRGLYTWWQRSYLHPSMLAFDAPTREECAAERIRSNIPQQALVLLNDPTYVEAARAFALRILREGGADTDARLTWAWEQALGRKPGPDEMDPLRQLLTKHLAEYSQDRPAAEALLNVGLQPVPKEIDQAELAAWTNIGRVILNLHETITRS